MNDNSFEKQFPNYPIIPSKKSRFAMPLITWGVMLGIVVVITMLFYKISQVPPPVSNISGFNSKSLATLGHLAISQANQGHYPEAAKNFKTYFDLGGKNVEAMAMYASSLAALGELDLAEHWADQAVARDPSSPTARFIKDSLGNPKK